MSLTTFVERDDIADELLAQFPNKGRATTAPLRAEWQTTHYSLVGTAFDYLARFWVEREVDQTHTSAWIANNGVAALQNMRHMGTLADDVDGAQLLDAAEAALDRAYAQYEDFLETGDLTDALVESALDLARLDAIYRRGALPTELGNYDDGDLQDCRALWRVLDDGNHLDGTEAYLNPRFGTLSSVVGGADADILLDGTLLDIKATKNKSFTAEYWRQLVGYAILADAHRMLAEEDIYDTADSAVDFSEHPIEPVDAVGIYFARHGDVQTVSTDAIYGQANYEQVRAWVLERAVEQAGGTVHPAIEEVLCDPYETDGLGQQSLSDF